MNISTILFDLDGTLIELVSEEAFSEAFFAVWVKRFRHLASPKELRAWIEQARDGLEPSAGIVQTRRDVFIETLAAVLEIEASHAVPMVEAIFKEEFPGMKRFWQKIPAARPTVEWLLDAGFEVVIATGMLFPPYAIEMKLAWAGIPPSEIAFLFISDWENMHAYKPQPDYYIEILEKIGKSPEGCLMVGDSWEHDMVPAGEVEIPAYWIAEEKAERPDPECPLVGQGNLEGLLNWFKSQSS